MALDPLYALNFVQKGYFALLFKQNIKFAAKEFFFLLPKTKNN